MWIYALQNKLLLLYKLCTPTLVLTVIKDERDQGYRRPGWTQVPVSWPTVERTLSAGHQHSLQCSHPQAVYVQHWPRHLHLWCQQRYQQQSWWVLTNVCWYDKIILCIQYNIHLYVARYMVNWYSLCIQHNIHLYVARYMVNWYYLCIQHNIHL